MLSLWLIRRDRYRRVHYYPLHPLSEEKAVRSLCIHIVTQKKPEKNGLLSRDRQSSEQFAGLNRRDDEM
jgi:hypothetical protein